MIVTSVAFALRLVDDFTGKAIVHKKFVFQINGQVVKPIEKEEGMYVFLEPLPSKERVRIISTDYYTCMALIEKEALDPKEPVADVRMYGRPGRNFPYRYGLIQGRVETGNLTFPVEVCAKKAEDTGLTLKEILVKEKEKHLVCQGFTKESLVGKTFAVSKKNRTEVFIITEKTGMNEYKIAGDLSQVYEAKTPIERVYRSVTDENGNYAIFVEMGEEEQITEVITLQNNQFHQEREGGLMCQFW